MMPRYRADYSHNMTNEDSSNYAGEEEGIPEKLQRLRKEQKAKDAKNKEKTNVRKI